VNPASAQPLNALAELRDIHLPAQVPIWPLAPGWWLLLALLVATSLALHFAMRARRRSLKRAALCELDGIATNFRANADVCVLARSLSTLLRRVAIARHPRRQVASLHGADWSRFLLQSCHAAGLDEDMLRDLTTVVYAGANAVPATPDVETWIDGARRWIGGNT
jgi:hypothetical protein